MGSKKKPIHRQEWISEIVNKCRKYKIPIFVKDNCRYDKVIKEFAEEEI